MRQPKINLIVNTTDTIAAIATPIGSAGIGVIRISGPCAFEVASRVFTSDPRQLPSHTAKHGRLVDPATHELLDDAVLTVFKSPKSYTGEDVAELSCHGGMATMKVAMGAVLEAGARLAAPGEFTQRAFLNGKLDLAQAEAVNDLIRSRTDAARKVALAQLDGELSANVDALLDLGMGVLAAVEAAIDFPDDVPEPDRDWIRDQTASMRAGLQELLAGFEKGRLYREGLRMAIVGRVNVGKSSLLNALLRHARAIVTPIPGTTRDLIEESVEIHGIPIVAIDTAGIRQTEDPVEKIGVDLTRKSIESADVVALVIDAAQGMHEEDLLLLDSISNKPVITVINKIDLVAESELENAAESVPPGSSLALTSAKTGDGIEEFEAALAEIAGGADTESAMVSNVRHKEALRSAYVSLGHVIDGLGRGEPVDLLSVDVAGACDSLGLITGKTASHDLLDRIFSEFCIGK